METGNDNILVTDKLTDIDYNNISNLSTFPQNLDRLKTIVFDANSSNKIDEDFKKYYALMDRYLADPINFVEIQELREAITNIQNYVLSSNDYSIIRDSLIEISHYLEEIGSTKIYGEKGIYNSLKEAITNFSNALNTIINNINKEYDLLENGVIGKIIPKGSININYLNNDLKDKINYIETTNGIYVDKTMGSDVQLPLGTKRKPIVIKVRNVI